MPRRPPPVALLAAPLSLLGVVVALGGCGASAPAPAPPPPTRASLGALPTLVPSDAAFVVLARPAELLAASATARVVRALFPDARLERFRAQTGIDPRRLSELVYAARADGRVVIARGPFDAELAVMEAGERMAPLESSAEAPFVRRAGLLGSRRIELAAPAPDVIVWVDGPPQLTAAVLASCARPEHERDHPFERGEVAEVAEALGRAPFLLHVPQPLGLAADTGVGMLLARERALGVAVGPTPETQTGGEALALRAELRGEFPDGAEVNFRALARSLAETDLGGVLGARDAYPTLRLSCAADRVSASAELEAAVLAAGLRAVLVAEMEELLEGAAPSPGPSLAPRRDSASSGEDAADPETPSPAAGSEASPAGASPELPSFEG